MDSKLIHSLGFLHSPIHLGYAIEFDQPLVAAEALALTAIHDVSFGDILELVEKNAPLSPASKSLIGLQQEIHSNQKLRDAMDYKHGVFQIQKGLLANAREEFLRVMGSWKVKPQELDEKTAEDLNASRTSLLPFTSVQFEHLLNRQKYTGRVSPNARRSRSALTSS